MKLSFKIFFAYILVSFLLFFLIMVCLRFFASKHIYTLMKDNDVQYLSQTANTLSEAFDPETGWGGLIKNPRFLNALLWQGMSDPLDQKKTIVFPFPVDRIAVFNAQKEHVAGLDIKPSSVMLRPVVSHDTIVGWIGLKEPSNIPHPFKGKKIKQKLYAFYTISLIIFILTGIVSFFLSRHLIAPIKKLTRGTRSLSNFNFNTRIEVNTRDELEELARHFNKMAKTLSTYETLQKQWMLDISHELRTPLSILKAETEAMIDGIRETNPKRIQSLHAEITYLMTLVNDLHFLSKEDVRELNMEREPVCPVSILKQELSHFDTRLSKANISVISGLEDDPVLISGNRARLKQLFANLIENVLKHAEKPGTLTIGLQKSPGQLTLFIEDSGPGVPHQALDRLFDRLFRVDPSREGKNRGSGLGLSICQAVVKSHDGTINAENVPDSGLKITIQFPVLSGEK